MRKVDELLDFYLPVFNEQQEIEGDDDMVLTKQQALNSSHFRHWLREWSDDDRGALLEHLSR
jgi:hypothetical protein